MDQVSRPVQILLLATLAFAALWFLALRPKAGGEAPSAPAPAAPAAPQGAAPPAASTPPAAGQPGKSSIPGGLGRSVDKAHDARQTNNDRAIRAGQTSAGGGEGSPALVPSPAGVPPAAPGRKGRAPASTPAQPIAGAMPHSDNAALESGLLAVGMVTMALGGESRKAAAPSARNPGARPTVASPDRVTGALAAHKTVVILFYGRGSDDRAMRREIAKVQRRGAKVMVLSAPVDTVSRFGVITSGVRVLQSPSVVVVSPSRKARVLPGFLDSTEIDQAVETALRS